MDKDTAALALQRKSSGVGILLAFIGGPLGLFYATATGRVVMLAATVVGIGVAAGLPHGFGLFGVPAVISLAWLISIVWAAVVVGQFNGRLAARSLKRGAVILIALALSACGGGGGGGSGGASGSMGTLRLVNTSTHCTLTRLDVSAPEFSDDFAIFIGPGDSQDFVVPAGIEYDIIIQSPFQGGGGAHCIVQTFLDIVIPAGSVKELEVDASF